MINPIYLISSDGYRDSIYLDFYVASEEDVKKLISFYRKEYLGEIVDINSFQIDLTKLRVIFNSKPDWDDEWGKVTYHLHKISKT